MSNVKRGLGKSLGKIFGEEKVNVAEENKASDFQVKNKKPEIEVVEKIRAIRIRVVRIKKKKRVLCVI